MNRDFGLDFVKAIAIILMVFGHATTDWPAVRPVIHWLSLFHMPVFLFVAGWFYDSKCARDWTQVVSFARKKVLRLWSPVFLWTSLLVLCHNFLLEQNFYAKDARIVELLNGRFTGWAVSTCYTWSDCLVKIWRAFCMRYLDILDGGLWFVQVLFFVLCLYCIGDRLLCVIARRFGMKERMVTLIGQSVVALLAIVIARYYCPWPVRVIVRHLGGVRMLPCYFLFHIGVLLRAWNVRCDHLGLKCRLAVGAACLCLTILMSRFGMVSLSFIKFPCILFLVVGSVAGWLLLLSVAWAPLSFVGRHTMAILIFHFLAFKTVNIVGVTWLGDDPILIAGWPTAYSGMWWCVAYTIVGVGVPLFLSMAYAKIKVRLRQLVKP